ncbi:RES domain-containing protein [Sinorhizobium meliloti]|nr:RES domain-containing protein [Sinorhizobium meliloti]
MVSVAELALDGEYKILDLVELDDGSDARIPILAMANSVLVAAPRIDRGWLRPEYVFSRFVADCAKSAGFEAIRYASTKSGDGENYVLLSPKSNLPSYLRLISVQIEIAPDRHHSAEATRCESCQPETFALSVSCHFPFNYQTAFR